MAEADTDTQSTDRCKALTSSGERCSRPAREDGFCYQHDESDSTVSESQTAEQQEQDQEQQEQEAESESQTDQETAIQTEETTDPEAVDTEDIDVDAEVGEEKIEGLLSIRRTVQSTAGEVIGRPFDGVSEITPNEDGWRSVVEVLERRAVPDTQDILGRYEIQLDEDGVIQGYRRLDRYRRGDTVAYESE